MKKTLIALAALASTAAFAQSTVTLSGGVAAGIGFTSAKSSVATGGTNGLNNLNDAAGNNITFAAVEDLGGGLKANARVNVRFNPATGANTGSGTAAGQFAQNVKLGLSGGFGEIAAGRFNTQIDLVRGTFDFFNAAGASGAVFGHPGDETTRYVGMAEYVTPVFSGFKGAVVYVPKSSLGATEGTTEGMVSYANGPVAAMVGYSLNTGNAAGTANTKDKDTLSLGASYDLGVAKLAVFHTSTDNPGAVADATRTSLHANMPVMGGGVILKAGYERQKTDGANAVNGFAFGVDYILSKRTKVIGDVWKKTSDTKASDDKSMNYMLGLKTTF